MRTNDANQVRIALAGSSTESNDYPRAHILFQTAKQQHFCRFISPSTGTDNSSLIMRIKWNELEQQTITICLPLILITN